MAHDTLSPSGFFVLRTPLLSWSRFEEWCDSGRTAQGPADTDEIRAKLRNGLLEIFSRADVAEALYLAAPNVLETLNVWQRAPTSEYGLRIERTLVRYLSRICGRSTPYGLFAGCSYGSLGATTNLRIADRRLWRRSTRLDMEFVGKIIRALSSSREVREHCTYTPNTTLYRGGGKWRWVEVFLDEPSGRRRHRLAAVDEDDANHLLVQRAQEGASWMELMTALADHIDGVSKAEVEHYLHSLLDSQLLVPDIEPPVTGNSPVDWLRGTLESMPDSVSQARSVAGTLNQAQNLLREMDDVRAIGDREGYQPVFDALATLPVDVQGTRALQVDLFKSSPSLSLGRGVVSELMHEFPAIWRAFAVPPSAALASFLERFERRYGEREVPLLLAVDPELGVGFAAGQDIPPAPLIADLGLRSAGSRTIQERTALRDAMDFRVRECLLRGEREWALTSEELHGLSTIRGGGELGFPEGLLVRGVLYSREEPEPAATDFRFLIEHASGPSVSRLLGRFAPGSPELASSLRAEVDREQTHYSTAVCAEIVHVPTDRVGNVIIRPVLRDYEIPVLGRAAVDRSKQLPLQDLVLKLEGGRLRLFSRRLGIEVLPRHATAHNFALPVNVPAYRLLCEFQLHRKEPVNLGWLFSLITPSPFLPRVVRGRLILSPATWFLYGLERLDILKAERPFEAVQEWRRRREVPRYVGVVDEDSMLPLDLENPLCVDSFVSMLARKSPLPLAEAFPEGFRPAVEQDGGPCFNELLIPLRRDLRPGGPQRTEGAKRTTTGPASTTFFPGSEWMFVKVYVGEGTADTVIATVAEVAHWAVQEGICQRWFFLRYFDPDHHLRFRFHGNATLMLSTLLPRLREALGDFESDHVWKIQLDTYEPEVIRYGGPAAIAHCEELFSFDSDAVAKLLATGLDEESRWLAILMGMDQLLDDSGIPSELRCKWVEQQRDALKMEFSLPPTTQKKLGGRYRSLRPKIEQALEENADSQWNAARKIFARRSELSRPTWSRLRELNQSGALTFALWDILGSLVHMHVNRLSRTAARAHEFVLYDYLARHYRTRAALIAARSRTGTPAQR